MKFDFVDTEKVVRKTRKLKGLLQDDSYEDYTYKTHIESTEDTALSTLTNAKYLLGSTGKCFRRVGRTLIVPSPPAAFPYTAP